MSWLFVSNLATCVTMLGFALFHLFLYLRDRDHSMQMWTAGWSLQFGKNLSDLLMVFFGSTTYLSFGSQIFALSSGFFIFLGTWEFLGMRRPRWLVPITGAGAAWILLVSLHLLPRAGAAILPPYAVNGVLFIAVGAGWIAGGRISPPLERLAGAAYIVWGVNKWLFPLFQGRPDLAAVRYTITLLMAGAVVLSTTTLYLEKIRAALRREEERYRLLAENARDVVFRLRLHPRPEFEYLSPSFRRVSGYSPDEIRDDPEFLLRKVHPADAPLLRQVLAPGFDFSHPLLLRFLRKDGSVAWTEQVITPVKGPDGEVVALEGIQRDVTGRVTMQGEKEKLREALEEVVETMPVGVCLLDQDLRVTFINPTGERLTGFTRKEWSGKTLGERLPELGSWKAGRVLERARMRGVRGRVECLGGREDRLLEVRVAPFSQGVVVFLRDPLAEGGREGA